MTKLTDQADFGWMLPTGHQRMPANPADYLAHVQQVMGKISSSFHSVWIPDHLMEGDADLPEALTTLSFLAGQFPTLFFGTIVISQSYRNPALLAKMAATLQQLSAGRFILGLVLVGMRESTRLMATISQKHPSESLRWEKPSKFARLYGIQQRKSQLSRERIIRSTPLPVSQNQPSRPR